VIPQFIKFGSPEGTVFVAMTEIVALSPSKDPEVCLLTTRHGIFPVNGTMDFLCNALESFFGQSWDATQEDNDNGDPRT